jgi:hypothetical protein
MSIRIRFCIPSPLRKHFHTNHFQSPPIRKRATVIPTRHRPLKVVVHELAEQSARWQSSQPTQVYRRFRVPFSFENTAWTCAERDHMTWTGEVCWCGGR